MKFHWDIKWSQWILRRESRIHNELGRVLIFGDIVEIWPVPCLIFMLCYCTAFDAIEMQRWPRISLYLPSIYTIRTAWMNSNVFNFRNFHHSGEDIQSMTNDWIDSQLLRTFRHNIERAALLNLTQDNYTISE